MRPRPEFSNLPADFWGYVRAASEALKYSQRGVAALKRYDSDLIVEWAARTDLAEMALCRPLGESTYLDMVVDYMNYRAEALEQFAQPRFMNRDEARAEFRRLYRDLRPKCLLPMNKQKGKKRHEAYLTCIVNMLTEAGLRGCDFDQDPHGLILFERDGVVLQMLSRRLDGAYPTIRNPRALWEVKEYYGTTTFGSRVADGVYETMLDGYELRELRQREGLHVGHYLVVDDRYTWWQCGKSYLCRIFDMLHMGLLDEVLFGREVLDRWPEIVAGWIAG